MNWMRGVAGVAVLCALLVFPKAASSQLFTTSDGPFTGGSNFQTSMNFNLTYNSTGLFTLEMFNLGSYGEVFTRVALVNVPDSWVFSAGSAPSGWVFNQTNLRGDGIPNEVYLYWAGSSPVANGIQSGGTGLFTFQLNNLVTNWQTLTSDIGAGVHAQAGPENCSTKYAVWREAGRILTNDGMGEGGENYDPGCVSVPEPGTRSLLAIGILGLGVAAIRKRSCSEILNA